VSREQWVKSHFGVLGVPVEFQLDAGRLATKFKALQRKWHPDRTHGSEEAARQSARINEAYQILREPHKRAAYMLDMLGASLGEEVDDLAMADPELLEYAMAARESIDEAESDASLRNIAAETELLVDQVEEPLQRAFQTDNLAEARRLTARLQYYNRILATIADKLPAD